MTPHLRLSISMSQPLICALCRPCSVPTALQGGVYCMCYGQRGSLARGETNSECGSLQLQTRSKASRVLRVGRLAHPRRSHRAPCPIRLDRNTSPEGHTHLVLEILDDRQKAVRARAHILVLIAVQDVHCRSLPVSHTDDINKR